MAFGNTSDRRGADGARVVNFPRIHHIQKKDHFHVMLSKNLSMLEDFRHDVCPFQSYPRRNGTKPISTNQIDIGIKLLMLNFAESRHPACRVTSVLERRKLKSKRKRKEINIIALNFPQWKCRQNFLLLTLLLRLTRMYGHSRGTLVDPTL